MGRLQLVLVEIVWVVVEWVTLKWELCSFLWFQWSSFIFNTKNVSYTKSLSERLHMENFSYLNECKRVRNWFVGKEGVQVVKNIRPLLMRNLFQLQKCTHKGRGRAVFHYHYVII